MRIQKLLVNVPAYALVYFPLYSHRALDDNLDFLLMTSSELSGTRQAYCLCQQNEYVNTKELYSPSFKWLLMMLSYDLSSVQSDWKEIKWNVSIMPYLHL